MVNIKVKSPLVMILNDRVIINGVGHKIPANANRTRSTVINDKIYIGMYRLKNKEWSFSLIALWYNYINV